MLRIATSAAAMGVGALLIGGGAQAAMSPAIQNINSSVQRVDCAVGFHLGPMGGCVIGVPDDPLPPPVRPGMIEEDGPPVVIEHRATDEGCETQSVNRTDRFGNSETRTTTNCK